MGNGHAVVVEALRNYSARVGADVAVATEVSGLVSEADVGDKSWGVVGIAVKGIYTDMLGELQDLIREMGAGLEAASEKFGRAADAYDRHENDSKKLLTEILGVLSDPARSRIPSINPVPER